MWLTEMRQPYTTIKAHEKELLLAVNGRGKDCVLF
jgi:hypothetical protein